MTVHLLPARTDNYIFVLREDATNTTIVIDPTDAEPVLEICSRHQWNINAILITHHHPDHITGVPELAKKYAAPVWGHKLDKHRLPPLDHEVVGGDTFTLGGLRFEVRFTPAHTLGHIAYWLPDQHKLFCGDTLFSMGCGRLFEGTPEMMLKNMEWIRTLPQDTEVFCSHEYTLTNTEFAMSVEPDNTGIADFYTQAQALRKKGLPTIPLNLAEQLALNPFLRYDDPSLRSALKMSSASDLDVFTRLRQLRNQW